MSKPNRIRQRGQVAVLFALAALAIVAIAGLALDAGQAFVSQRALQAGSDTAAQSAATMLAVDYNECATGVTGTGDGTYSQAAILAEASALAQGAAAGQGRSTAPPSAAFVNFSATTSTVTPWVTVPSFCAAGSWVGPSGIQVRTTDTHPTAILGVIGIKTATESASTVALIGVATSAGGAPYGVWGVICPTTTIFTAGQVVTLLSPQWDRTTCGSYMPSSTRASFDGYFKLPGPISLAASGCIQTGTGSGNGGASSNQPTAGSQVFVPLIQAVYSFGTTPPPDADCPAIATSGTFDLVYKGFVNVTILGNTPTSTIEGTVNYMASDVPGLTICPVRDTSCSSPNNSPVVAYIWH